MTRRFLDYVHRSLIAGAAKSAKVGQLIRTAMAAIHNVADMQPHSSSRVQIVGIAGACPAHLAGIAVALQNLGAYAGRNGASKSVVVMRGWFGNQFVFTGFQAAVVVVGDDRPALVVSQLTQAARPFRYVQPGGLSYLHRSNDPSNVSAQEFANAGLGTSSGSHPTFRKTCRINSCPMNREYAGGIASLISFFVIQLIPIASRAAAMVQFPPPVT